MKKSKSAKIAMMAILTMAMAVQLGVLMKVRAPLCAATAKWILPKIAILDWWELDFALAPARLNPALIQDNPKLAAMANWKMARNAKKTRQDNGRQDAVLNACTLADKRKK